MSIDVWDWTASCRDVPKNDCKGVAKLFVNNLARSGTAVFEDSDGTLTVEPRPRCPSRLPDWADPTYCWQANAASSAANGPDVCMIIARGPGRFGFGQVGGDDLTGRFVAPDWWQPCD